MFNYFWSIGLIILAGVPPTKVLAGTSLVTTEPAAITAPSPMVTLGQIVQWPPIQTSLPILTGLPIPKRSRRPWIVRG